MVRSCVLRSFVISLTAEVSCLLGNKQLAVWLLAQKPLSTNILQDRYMKQTCSTRIMTHDR